MNFVISLYRRWFGLLNFGSVFFCYSVFFDIIFYIFSLFYKNILIYKFFVVEFFYSFVSVVVIFEYGISIFFFKIDILYFVDGF